jgi:hypothetical protein
MMRDTRNLALLILQAPIIGLFLLLVSKSDSLTRVNDPTSDAKKVLLLLAISAIWLGTINSSREIVKELPIYRRERVSSKILVLSGLCIVQAALLLATVALRVDLPADGPLSAGPIEMFVSLSLAAVAAMAMGLLLSAATTTQERAVGLVPLKPRDLVALRIEVDGSSLRRHRASARAGIPLRRPVPVKPVVPTRGHDSGVFSGDAVASRAPRIAARVSACQGRVRRRPLPAVAEVA